MQITLGQLIEKLENTRHDAVVRFDFCGFWPDDLYSYRGYYDQLAISHSNVWPGAKKEKTVSQLLSQLKAAVGKTFGIVRFKA